MQKWYNQLLDKDYNDLEVLDVTRMIKQKKFLELATAKAMDCNKANPFCGDLWERKVLELLCKLDMNYLKGYCEDLNDILLRAFMQAQEHEWLCEEEKVAYSKLVGSFLKKINSNIAF